MFKHHTWRFWAVVIVVLVAVAFYLPSLVAFRYTASPGNRSFLTHPWRSWGFAATVLTVPGDSKLKTSGLALRKADNLFAGSAVDPREVRLLYLPEGRPYTFTHTVAGHDVTTTITPPYRFVWQVKGIVEGAGSEEKHVVALFDYESGDVLYDVRRDLGETPPSPPPATTTSPSS